MSEIKDFLRQVDLFSGLSDQMLTKVANLCQSQTFETESIIVERTSPPENFYLIQQGTVKILTGPDDETESLAAVITLGKGQSFGEMGLIDSGPRSATVEAATNTDLLTIECQRFLDLCEADTTLGYIVMRNIAADLSFKLRNRNLI